MKVICYGDSNTYGYDPRSYFGGRYTHPWPKLLADKTGWQVFNWGENGLTIPTNPVSFPENTDILLLMLGTNDLLQMRSPEETAERMEVFLGKINLDRERILLLAPPPMEFGEWVPDPKLIHNLAALKKLYRALAERMCLRFVSPEQHQIMAYDGVHMTQAGHRELAEQLYTYFQEENGICWKKE